jgi:hypothetical protein
MVALEKELAALRSQFSTLTYTARRGMERSAEQAGNFKRGRNRLLMPALLRSRNGKQKKLSQEKRSGRGGSEPAVLNSSSSVENSCRRRVVIARTMTMA